VSFIDLEDIMNADKLIFSNFVEFNPGEPIY